MAKREVRQLSKESFGNNADLLVFPDRHEYRTRSRRWYFASGMFVLACAAMTIWGCVLLLVVWPSQDAEFGRTIGVVATAMFLPFIVLFLLMVQGFFRTNPLIFVSPKGVRFHNRLEFMHLRAQNFLVPFDDIERVVLKTWGDKGIYEPSPTTFRQGLEIHTGERGRLLLRWSTFNRDRAVRFADAFLASLKEMAGRSAG